MAFLSSPPLPICTSVTGTALCSGHFVQGWPCSCTASCVNCRNCSVKELKSKTSIIKFSSCILQLEQRGVWGVECRCSESQLALSYSGFIVVNSNKLPFGYFPRGMFVDSVHKGSKDVYVLGKIIIQITVFF